MPTVGLIMSPFWRPTLILGTSSLIGLILFVKNNNKKIKDVSNQPPIFKCIAGLSLLQSVIGMGLLNLRHQAFQLYNNPDDQEPPAITKEEYVAKIKTSNYALLTNIAISGFLVYENIKTNQVYGNRLNLSMLNNENYASKHFNYIEIVNICTSIYILWNRINKGYDQMYESAKPYCKLFK